MTTKQWAITACCLALAVTGVVGAGWRRPAARTGSGDGDISITILDPPARTPSGLLVIQAKATIPPQPLDLRLSWHVALRSAAMEPLADQEYARGVFTVRKGASATRVFAERLEMPAGNYNVLVSLLDDRWTMHADASLDQKTPVCQASKTLTVR